MVNLIAEKQVVPELVQDDFTSAKVVDALNQIIPDGVAREIMLEGLAGVKVRLRSDARDDLRHPADRAAEAILGCRKGPRIA